MNKQLVILVLAILTLGGVSEGYAQKKKKKNQKKTTAAAPNTVATKPAAPAKPAEEVSRVVPMDSLDYNSTGYNPMSSLKIHKARIMYRMRLTREIDLNEKCNGPFFNRNLELSRFILDGLMSQKLTAYNDSMNRTLLMKDLKTVLVADPDPTVADDELNAKPTDFARIQFTEDYIYDRQRSQTRFDILSVRMVLPMNSLMDGIPPYDKLVGNIRYNDLVAYLNTLPQARWKNPINNSEDKTIPEAFNLRLFCSRITKILKDNPTADDISGMEGYNGSERTELLASQKFEYDLVSFENELYDY